MLELNDIFGDSSHPPNLHDLQKMRYLEQVIKESLRLYPSVPAYGRLLTTDISIGW
jgi:cytochrome P450